MNPEVKLNTDSQHPATVEVKASAEAGRADGEPAAADTATAREAGAGKGTGRRRRRRAELRELESELKRERYRARYIYTIRSTIFTLITVAAVAVLIATLWMPVLQIYGSSMTPTLEDGDVVVSRKTGALEQGDVTLVGFGRWAHAYPKFAQDIIDGKYDPSQQCHECGGCSKLLGAQVPSGCVVNDETFKALFKEHCQKK